VLAGKRARIDDRDDQGRPAGRPFALAGRSRIVPSAPAEADMNKTEI